MASLSLDSVRKEFGGEGNQNIVAVDDVDLDIEDGEFIVLVGPSGSGKSTILRLISGLEELTDGEIYIGDEPVSDVKPKNRDIAMVFQNYALYPHLTARKNMSFGLRMQGEFDDDEIDRRVEKAADIMNIEPLLEKMPNELSGGQQQRVALGRAIVREPKAFLMDEPLSNLDAKLRTTMRTEIQQLQSELDVTTIYVTHDQVEAMTMGDRIAIMNHGELQQVATPLEAYYEPSNVFVAGFIGSPSMNFIDTTVRFEHGDAVLEHPSFSYHLSEELSSTLEDGYEEAILGIRPESIKVVDEPTRNSVSVSIDVVEPLGKEQILYFTLDDGEQYTASVEGHRFVTEGEELELLFPVERLHLFNTESQEAIVNRELPAREEDELPDQLDV
ncbi:ABC transporter ATP-binding protein [Halomicrococcus sp. NG-SE-24]|uniref:ABC transporter ATP-binding protein n=1 Tax=Halomicrococcus sp. NG-SE-24 TaxID=3436928 RepID=UPI003D99B75D